MNPKVLSIIKEVVKHKVDEDLKFTAFDVSRDVQKKCREDGIVPERHRHMKKHIHLEMSVYIQENLYERSLEDIGANTKAFVYFPEGTCVEDYVPQEQNADLNLPNYTVAATANDASDVPKHNDFIVKSGINAIEMHPDHRGTVSVPASFVREIGASRRDQVFVWVYNEEIKISNSISTFIPAPTTSYTVDDYMNVRITQGVLNSANLTSPYKMFTSEEGNDKVVVIY